MSSDLARANAFEEALRERCSERVLPFRFGKAFFNDTYAGVWDLNAMRVDGPAAADAQALAEEAERVQGGAGLAHRNVVVRDEDAGTALAPGFRRLGWQANPFVLMAYRGRGPRSADTSRVEEVEAEALRSLRTEISRAEPWATDEDTVRMVVEGNRLFARAGNGRHFAVREDGRVVAGADLFSDGRTAQVEDVATLPAHRGRGHASAVVLRAVDEAVATDHDLVFLGADDDDWPKDLYARLGFVAIGRGWQFLRPPAPAGPA